jgi:hypothetical protein
LKFDTFQHEQRQLNESLCSLHCVAKWLWHGQFTKPTKSRSRSFSKSAFDSECGQLIKWSAQVINTAPEVMMLNSQEDNGQIILKEAGVYEVQFLSFVSPECDNVLRPCVQVRVNNKPVLTNIESKHSMIYHRDDDKQVTFTCYLRIIR